MSLVDCLLSLLTAEERTKAIVEVARNLSGRDSTRLVSSLRRGPADCVRAVVTASVSRSIRASTCRRKDLPRSEGGTGPELPGLRSGPGASVLGARCGAHSFRDPRAMTRPPVRPIPFPIGS